MKTEIIGKDLVVTNEGERVKMKILRKNSKYYVKTLSLMFWLKKYLLR
jgi:hypothetical protein